MRREGEKMMYKNVEKLVANKEQPGTPTWARIRITRIEPTLCSP